MNELPLNGAFARADEIMVGTRNIPGAGWRVVLAIGERAMHMPASEARRMAVDVFETPYARLNGFTPIADKLRENADWVDRRRGRRDRE